MANLRKLFASAENTPKYKKEVEPEEPEAPDPEKSLGVPSPGKLASVLSPGADCSKCGGGGRVEVGICPCCSGSGQEPGAPNAPLNP